MYRSIALLALAMTLSRPAAAVAESDDPGRMLYLRYCGACHGPTGHGDGIAGTFLRPKPADLTQIAKTKGGVFPFDETMKIIDGRNSVRAHGDPGMPVWGEVMRDNPALDPSRRAGVRGTILMITEYLRAIQEK